MKVNLEFDLPEFIHVDVRTLLPGQVMRCTPAEIEHLELTVGRRRTALGEICRVTCISGGDNELVLGGSTRWLKHVGWGMDCGRLVVDGGVGFGAGSEMSGGELEINGKAGDCLGAAMHGGLIRLHGSAGDWCAANLPGQDYGMSGGTILVDGSTGAFTGMAMRRGLVWVGGGTGEFCGERMLAGTILCAGKVGRYAGRGMKRGSLVAGSNGPPLPGFRGAGRADGEWLRICYFILKGLGIELAPYWLERTPSRFTGDHLEMGKGEMLVYDLSQ